MTSPQTSNIIPLPPAAIAQGDYGFIGRDHIVKTLERALQQQAQAGLLIHGIAGIGKTTLVQGFLKWLQQTNSLKANIFWFRFDDIRSFEFMVNQMIEGLFGAEALISPIQQKMDNLCAVFKQNPFILVWDNFEYASGLEDMELMPLLSVDDRKQLKEFLQRLHNSKTKVIITSCLTENWLSNTECTRMPLGGLQGEEFWQYCHAVAHHFGLALDHDDINYRNLMEKLHGHPLAMRAVLLKLDETPVNILLQEFEQISDHTEPGEVIAHTNAAFGLLESSFPPEYTAVLQFIGLHQRYLQLNTLVDMMRNSELATGKIIIKACITVLEHVGLLRPQEKGIYTIHPVLNQYLKHHHPAEAAVQAAFVDLMGYFADHLAAKEFNEQRAPFFIHSANFYYALSLARTFEMDGHAVALTQSLAVFAQNNQDFEGAMRLYESLANLYSQHSDDLGLASCYHQLGRIAQERRDFVSAEQWYLRSLAMKEQDGDEQGIANTYAQLGTLKQIQQHWITAAQWFIKAAVIFNNSNDIESVARVAKIYIALLQQSGASHQNEINRLWQQSGMEQTADLFEESNKIDRNYH